MRFLARGLLLAAALAALGSAASAADSRAPSTDTGGYRVDGNRIIGPSGEPVFVRGVDRPSLEWSSLGDHLSATDFARMASGWHANAVRISLNQDFWLQGSCEFDATYAGRVEQAVGWAEAAGMIVILDLHWSDRGADRGSTCDVKPGQQLMADHNSLAFWREVAHVFKGDPRVWFELYNEPHDISWPIWRDGGTTSQGWQAVGMQQLYDAIRASGADNIVIAGGLNWGFDLSGLPKWALHGDNIAYATHPYDYGGKQPVDWPRAFGHAAQQYPVIATEFGQFDCKSDYEQAVIDYAAAHRIGWTAWAWYPGGCKFPALIADWSGTPTEMGEAVKDALVGPAS